MKLAFKGTNAIDFPLACGVVKPGETVDVDAEMAKQLKATALFEDAPAATTKKESH